MVYFIQAGDGGPIKIGTSKDPLSRLRTLQTAHLEPLRLLGVLHGSYKRELEIHKRFKELRVSGEWFRFDQSIVDFVDYGGPIPPIPDGLRAMVDAREPYTGRTAPLAVYIEPVASLSLSLCKLCEVAQKGADEKCHFDDPVEGRMQRIRDVARSRSAAR